MTVPVQAAFWVWYQTGLEGSGRRSLRKTAKKTKRGLKTLVDWAETYSWDELAEEKDRETGAGIERAIMKKIIDNSTELLDRQRRLIALVYDKAYSYLMDEGTKVPPEVLIRFLEYESNLHGSGAAPQAGLTLRAVLEIASPEVRNGILQSYRELRGGDRSGNVLRVGMGPGDPGRN